MELSMGCAVRGAVRLLVEQRQRIISTHHEEFLQLFGKNAAGAEELEAATVLELRELARDLDAKRHQHAPAPGLSAGDQRGAGVGGVQPRVRDHSTQVLGQSDCQGGAAPARVNHTQREHGPAPGRLRVLERRGSTLRIEAPTEQSVAPRGYYMLFVLNCLGVPSVAEFVQPRL
jgi:hypothetical protein